MTTNFERWEKDPFFSAAEEVQESADRMESIYRTWIKEKDSSSSCNKVELRRDLRTSLETTKWQLEVFERAVTSSYKNPDSNEARSRHHQFLIAMEDKISLAEKALQETSLSTGKSLPPTPWVQLDQGERDELALFLSGPKISSAAPNEPDIIPGVKADASAASNSHGHEQIVVKEEKPFGHRRTNSASADIGSWKIAIDEENESAHRPSSSSPLPEAPPPRRVPSYSAIMESAPKLKMLKNGFRKVKGAVDDDITLLRPPLPLSRGALAGYDRSKSCLNNCDECYDKPLNGWYGALQRLLQRSQYQMQYSRPMQLTIWVALLLFSIVFLVRVF